METLKSISKIHNRQFKASQAQSKINKKIFNKSMKENQ